MTYLARAGHPQAPSARFLSQPDATSGHVFGATTPQAFVEAGTMVWLRNVNDATQTGREGFVVYRLPAPMPHLYLRERSSGLAHPFGGEQVAHRLGMPFDGRFEAFAPAGYDADTFHILSPDVMAMLLDSCGGFDVEIVDRFVILHSHGPLPVDQPELWAWIDGLARTLIDRLAHSSYRDRRPDGTPFSTPTPAPARAGDVASSPTPVVAPQPPRIAPQGQRMATGMFAGGLPKPLLYAAVVAVGLGALVELVFVVMALVLR